MGAALLVSSCTTGAGAGAYAGSSLGSVLGSAIGGIVGGPHGSDVGTIFGMAGGAVVGGALGDAAEKAQRRSAQQYDDDTYASGNSRSYSNGGNSGNYVGDDFDPSQMVDNSNSGDDRIDFGAPSSSGANATMGNVPMANVPMANVPMSNAPSSQSVDASRVEQIYGNVKSDGKLTIRNVRFADSNGDGMLSGDEIGQVSFEIYNETAAPIYNFDPSVVEAEANKRIYISPSVRVENIMPGQGLRYTATVKADRRIKDGEIRLLVSAQKEGKSISYVTVVKVATQRQ